jgi:predicted membrane protein
MLTVTITNNAVSSNPVYAIQHYVIKFVSDFRQVCGFLRVLGCFNVMCGYYFIYYIVLSRVKEKKNQTRNLNCNNKEATTVNNQLKIWREQTIWGGMAMNATFNNISVISWRSVLLVLLRVHITNIQMFWGPSWSGSYSSWIYNYLC